MILYKSIRIAWKSASLSGSPVRLRSKKARNYVILKKIICERDCDFDYGP